MPAPVATVVKSIILKSIKSPRLKLQIRSGHSEQIQGTNRREMTSPQYVEFSAGIGKIEARQMQKVGMKSREEMLVRVRAHVSYKTTFVVWGDDADESEKELVASVEKQAADRKARLDARRTI